METRWRTLNPDPEATTKILKILGCHEIVARLLVNRGITTPEDAFIFLNPSFQHLTDPFKLKDINKAVERIYTAICNKEKILIFGDFDADGVTATVLLNHFLHYVEADVSWYIPHRIREGYSLKLSHIEMAVKQKCDLIITVDCGSDSHDAVKAAIKEDIDIIITDHHEITRFRPPAFAVINPKQKDCTAGLEHLAGVGVAFYLIVAMRSYLREQRFWEDIPEPNLIAYCDLFAIGTIADMVPLKAENRILAKVGILEIQKGKRIGLKALVEAAKLVQSTIDSDDIAFKIAPRINAAGRISHSRICVDLLMETNSNKAEQTAFILEELNKKRQDTERWIVEEIEKQITLNPEIIKKASIVMENSKWNSGVLGIVASKIAKKYYCPAVLISTASVNSAYGIVNISSSKDANSLSQKNAISQNFATGSCRSIGDINIHDALSKCSDLLENFGGHAMAAGISIKPENILQFAERFDLEIAKKKKLQDSLPETLFDGYLNFSEISDNLIEGIEKLKPFGSDNPEPLFHCSDVKVISTFMIGSKHRKMVLEQTGQKERASKNNQYESLSDKKDIDDEKSLESKTNVVQIEAIQFNIANIDSSVQQETEDSNCQEKANSMSDRFDKIAFRVKTNRFGDKRNLLIIIEQAYSSPT